jgi:predicted thioesterase
MDFTLEPGITNNLEKTVLPSDSASVYGSGAVDVFSTPALIAFMEKTAHESIQSLLPEGYTTVGTEVNIKHLKATPIGRRVTCQSKLVAVDGWNLVFEVNAMEGDALIGSGMHSRFVVDKKRFLDKLR